MKELMASLTVLLCSKPWSKKQLSQKKYYITEKTTINPIYRVWISTMSPSSSTKLNPTFFGLNGRRFAQTIANIK